MSIRSSKHKIVIPILFVVATNAFSFLPGLPSEGIDDSKNENPLTVSKHKKELSQPFVEWSENCYWLQGYLEPEFTNVAEQLEAGRGRDALNLLSRIQLVTQTAKEESHYIKGLCLQSVGKFTDATTQYGLVLKLSNDAVLKGKASIGLRLAKLKDAKIQEKQIRFPGRTRYPAMDIEPSL